MVERAETVEVEVRDRHAGRADFRGEPPEGVVDLVLHVVRGEVDWQALRESAWRRQREQFSDRSMASAVAAVYDRVLNGVSKRSAGQ